MTSPPSPPDRPAVGHRGDGNSEPLSGVVAPSPSWPVRPGLPSDETPTESVPGAGGSNDWLWGTAPPPPGGNGGGGAVPYPPAPQGPPYQVEVHVTLHEPVMAEPDPTWWQRLVRVSPYRVSPLVAGTAVMTTIFPIPTVGYGFCRVWGSFLHHIGTDIHPVPSHIAAAVSVIVVFSRIHRPCRLRATPEGRYVRQLSWLDAFGVATTLIGGTWGVLIPDIVEIMTGVRG